MKVCIIYERSETGWSAYPPGLPGVAATGRTIEEARERLKGAIELHIADMTHDELVDRDTPGEFAELVDVGPAISEEAHWEFLKRAGMTAVTTAAR
jgi:predicted RNase H-like HicB family nuclease